MAEPRPDTRFDGWRTPAHRLTLDGREQLLLTHLATRWPLLPLFELDAGAGGLDSELRQLEALGPQPSFTLDDTPRPHGLLELVVTTRCDLACTYCNVNHGQSYRRQGAVLDMPLPVMQRAFELLLERAPQLVALDVLFFGGEPLLVFDRLIAFVSWARTVARPRGLPLSFVMSTNLHGATPAQLQTLVEQRIRIQVSLDGPPELHDLHRRTPGGQPTHRTVLANLEQLRELSRKYFDNCVSAAITITRAEPRSSRLFEYLEAVGLAGGFAQPVQPGTTRHDSAGYLLDLASVQLQAEDYLEYHVRRLRELPVGATVNFSYLPGLLALEQLAAGPRPVRLPSCGAGRSSLGVLPSGEVVYCKNHPELHLGTVASTAQQLADQVTRLHARYEQAIAALPCADCSCNQRCGSLACPGELLAGPASRAPDAAPPGCRATRATFELSTRLYLELARHGLLEKAASLRAHEFDHSWATEL